ncbi:SusC/RagA family TonB-linked outer membrane protein [Sphingobacterium pedocola]|uniref:SusC/RagA family TonB-linked outer membrane protein n=1 Tax=Sphingobacterium pedocola TaxID=2082722 RepID=A0ABR9T3P3_9SPHI|nr:SusC/RagA family TonB-linked outer membrane protein [Sphingobacterium pedocola]MBE8719659.1 SusC/RagA family TonB-linked outer membrane protein [Sphingobacterium pedocola]
MNRAIVIIWVLFMAMGSAYGQQVVVRGTVSDGTNGKPLSGATVKLLRNEVVQTKTSESGLFEITAERGDTLVINNVGYERGRIAVGIHSENIRVELFPANIHIDDVEVVSTGYQNIPRERATGSFDIIDNSTFNRSVTPDVLSRLENLSPGLLFNRGDAQATDPILIRGRSTITADASPLIVLDNFPYDGDINNINPNDIENVSILKDAAAASIWGARAANGVIVINTKRGRTSKPSVAFNHNISFRGKPDLYNISWISAADRVEWERFLFENGRYTAAQAATTFAGRVNPIPEAVELMIENPTDLEERLAELKTNDVREDLGRYFYRPSLQQQHSVQLSGHQDRLNYVFSSGYDHDRTQLVGQATERITLRTVTSYKLTEKLRLGTTISFIQNNLQKGNNDGIASDYLGTGNGISPYARFADVDGNPMAYYSNFRKGFVNTVGDGYLMDWTYRPLEEIHRTKTDNKVRDLLMNLSADYSVIPGVGLTMLYQYQNQGRGDRLHAQADSYGARNTVNRFTQIDYTTGNLSYPVPQGGQLWLDNLNMQGHQGRLQLNVDRSWNAIHQLNGVAGYEIRSKVTAGNSTSYYGYNADYEAINNRIDYITRYPVHNTGGTAQIPLSNNRVSRLTDNFLSMYANASYHYKQRYTLSGSLRKDEANLFGVESNMRGTPLWSVGAAWQLHDEPFYHWRAVEKLRLRGTYGVNGNISRIASTYAVGTLFNNGMSHNMPAISITTPPNEKLRWEKVKTLNLAMEFAVQGGRVNGTIEYYRKQAVDLLAQTPADPTLGFTSVYANTASMLGKGLDIQLNTVNTKGRLRWETNLVYAFNKATVLEYTMPVSEVGRTYVTSLNGINPIIDMPLYTAYSFKWGGLHPDNGAPQGYVDGELSTDFNVIYNNTKLSDLVYHGPTQPTHFGALRNSFSVSGFQMSFNISYKFGHYFRTNSVSNAGIISGWSGHGDFSKRWQQPGDEKITNVPAMIYPANANRDNVYRYASVHIHSADLIRLEDLNLSYSFAGSGSALPFQQLRLYIYASNLATLWYANKADIDPYFNNVPKQARTIALGVSANF